MTRENSVTCPENNLKPKIQPEPTIPTYLKIVQINIEEPATNKKIINMLYALPPPSSRHGCIQQIKHLPSNSPQETLGYVEALRNDETIEYEETAIMDEEHNRISFETISYGYNSQGKRTSSESTKYHYNPDTNTHTKTVHTKTKTDLRSYKYTTVEVSPSGIHTNILDVYDPSSRLLLFQYRRETGIDADMTYQEELTEYGSNGLPVIVQQAKRRNGQLISKEIRDYPNNTRYSEEAINPDETNRISGISIPVEIRELLLKLSPTPTPSR